MRRPFRWFIFGAGVLPGCGPSVADYCAPGSPECTGSDAAVADAAADAPVEAKAPASRCDPTKAPRDEPCVVDDAHGIFVSTAGSDTGSGAKSAPVRSIGRAMDLAKAAGKRVYVCGGTYSEPLLVGSSRDGVNVYGALDCTTWTYGAANKVVVAPAESGYALELEGLQSGATFEDVEFDAQRASAAVPGASSVAVFVSGSQGVSFHRVTMVAGKGSDGAAGGSIGASTNWLGTPPAYAELNGDNAGDAGAPIKLCACRDQSQTSGGQGGGPMNIPSPGGGTPEYSDAGVGAGGMNALVCGSGGSPPANGADAPAAVAAVPSTSPGVCSASGWLPGVGAAGADGRPGQGGGGGGNGRLSAGSGGGGACGGCGGAGGKPGQGGGASIALLSFQSGVALVGCSLTANAAGNGGAGGAAEAGQGGGIMGGNGNLGGCAGGAGGAGAGGNGGQGGPGGLSLGIGYVSTPPTIDGALVPPASTYAGITVGAAGAGGAAGLRGASATHSTGSPGALGASGPSGVAVAVEAVP